MVPADVRQLGRAFTNVKVDSTLEVLDDKATTFRSFHSYTVRAELPGRFYVRTYVWTGTDHNDTSEVVSDHDIWGHPRHRCHGRVIREGSSRIVVVDLGRTLEPGEIEEIHIRHELRDLGGTFLPRLGHVAKQGNEQVDLAVVLPARLADKAVFREFMNDTGHEIDMEHLTGVVQDSGAIRFSKRLPTPTHTNRTYRICWGRLA
jgi:hypothetical protein